MVKRDRTYRKSFKQEARNYYRKDGHVFIADHVINTVSAPSSVKKEDYPKEIKNHINNDKYVIQLTIE